ncbi:hypothetical protein KSS87_001487 [Heliosperma pusillum]|nr:hypothetical protein KSS87_001487 [Heliosperma pusillum]
MQRFSMLARQVICAMVMVNGVCYEIWRMRNVCRLEGVVLQPMSLVIQVKSDYVSVSGMSTTRQQWCRDVGSIIKAEEELEVEKRRESKEGRKEERVKKMDPKVREVSQTFERFKAALVRCDFETCTRLLSQLKVLLTEFRSLPPLFEATPNAVHELTLARDIYEHAVVLSVKMEDQEAFERDFCQLKPYYTDARSINFFQSPRRYHIYLSPLLDSLQWSSGSQLNNHLTMIWLGHELGWCGGGDDLDLGLDEGVGSDLSEGLMDGGGLRFKAAVAARLHLAAVAASLLLAASPPSLPA